MNKSSSSKLLIKKSLEKDLKSNTTAENTRSHKRHNNNQEDNYDNYDQQYNNKKRWSFNSSTRITTSLLTTKEDLGIKPLSPTVTRSNRNCLFNNSHNNNNNMKECDVIFHGAGKISNYPVDFHRFYRKRKSTSTPSSPFNKLIFTDNSDGHNPFNTLPDEMILRVLKWLPKPSLGSVSQVNKRFSRLIEDESLWINIDCLGKVLTQLQLNIILNNRKPHHLRLARTLISGSSEVFTSNMLLYLDLSMSIISEQTLSAILKSCPKLQKLSLEHLQTTKCIISSITTNSLDTLNMTMCFDLQDSFTFATLLKRQKGLQHLNLGCIKCDWTEADLSQIIKSLPSTIEQLNLAGFRNIMKDHHVGDLVSLCPKLIDLDLSDCQELTFTSLTFIKKLKDLQHLGLSRCYSIDPQYYSILTQMKCLRSLELFSLFKDTAIKSLTNSLPGIEINRFPLSQISRPTVGVKRSSIWAMRVRD